MPNWSDLITEYYQACHADDASYEFFVEQGCSRSQLLDLERAWQCSLPREFQDFYGACNGVGLRERGERRKIWWLFVPICDLGPFGERCREWFQDTHPDLSAYYYPFIDWSSGDSMGYRLTSGVVNECLYEFEHEAYEFNPDQDDDEVLRLTANGIEDWLRRIIDGQ